MEAALRRSSRPSLSSTPSGLHHRTLSVTVTAARGLKSVERGGKNDAYALVSLIDGVGDRPITAELSQKTRVVESTDPVWNSAPFIFGKELDIKDDDLPKVRVEVFDKESFGSDRPLGRADIPLQAGESGFHLDDWVPLQAFGKLRPGANLGDVKVTVSLEPPAVPDALPSLQRKSSSFLNTGIFGVMAETDELPDFADSPPNKLKITILQARKLKATDKSVFGADSSDPMVKIIVEGQEKSTKVIKETLNPVWNETFELFALDSSGAIHLLVEDFDTTINDFLGSVHIPLNELTHKKKVQKWYPLVLKDGTPKVGKSLGDIELQVQWYYDPAATNYKRKVSMMSKIQKTIGTQDESSDTDGGEGDGEDGEEVMSIMADDEGLAKKSKQELEEEEKKKKEEEEKLKSTLMDMEVKSGDYMLYVHIIEVRDLKGEDVQGTSDPVVTVEAFGQRFTTEMKPACLNAVFDEQFVFNCRNLDKEEVENGVIRVCCMDADVPIMAGVNLKNDLIGAYSFDADYVYFQKNHEMYRVWVALMDDENPEDSGVQGYLKLSIQIVGPGDKMVVHNEEEDRKKEKEEKESGASLDSLAIMPPTIDTEKEWLVTTFWKAEYLPIMDTKLIGSGGGGDFFCELKLAGGKHVRTKKKTMKGQRSALNPCWRTELWQPVTLPCQAGNIRYAVVDYDTVGDNEIVGVWHSKLRTIEKFPNRKRAPYWVNLYGPPLQIPDSAAIKAVGKRAMKNDINWEKRYREQSNSASTFRGRILISEAIIKNLPSDHEHEKIAWRKKVSHLNASLEPTVKQYGFRVFVGGGTEIPLFKSLKSLGTKSTRMFIKFSIGKYEKCTTPVHNTNGVCEWNELVQSDQSITLPEDPAQMPDLLIHLMKDDGSDSVPICFMRISAKDLLIKGFNAEPEWMLFKEDKVLDDLEDGEFPGNVLLKIGFGKYSDFDKSADAWNSEARNLGKRVPYIVRFHLYQARDLPACDDNGLLDPYLKINLLGETINTEVYKDPLNKKNTLRRRKTTDPMWYKSLDFEVLMAPPELKKYWPQVNVQVWDYDVTGLDDYCGTLFVSLADVSVEVDTNIGSAPLPKWMPFFLEEAGDGDGELLASLQVIQMIHRGGQIPAPESIVPVTRPAFVEMIAIGLRGAQPYQMIPLQFPFVEFELAVSEDNKKTFQTASSKKPTGTDANFLQRIHVETPLPVNEIFSPRVKIRVFDVRLGGFLKPMVAVGYIDLVNKVPWSSSYKPPTANPREAAAIAMKETAVREEQETAAAVKKAEEEKAKKKDGGHEEEKENGNGGVEEKKEERALPTSPASADAGAGVLGGVSVQPPPPTAAGGVLGGDLGVTPAADVAPAVSEALTTEAGAEAAATGLPPPDEDVEEEEGPPKYMVGRKTLTGSLEDDLITTPFETFELWRGQGEDRKVVGHFKCLFRVTEVDPDVDLLFVDPAKYVEEGADESKHAEQWEIAKKENERIMSELLLPKGYKIRLYVLRAINLTPMDPGIGGRPGKSDPYLLTKLGKTVVDNSSGYIEDVTDADLYEMVEFNTELPGAGRLDINVMDFDDIGANQLIGRTVVDLEDRWFDQRWQDWGKENRQEKSDNPANPVRFQTKPLEIRGLTVPTSRAPQGILECWVDIMNPSDAGFFPPDDVALPPTMQFEVRVVIWKCKDVVNMDEFTSMNDLYVKCWIEGVDPQETDTHWRAKKGKGSFNWRMKFPVELGPRTRSYKFPYFTIQMWDKDLLYNDVIAEGMLDLGKYFRKAYKKKTILKLFEEASNEKRAKLKAEKEADLKNMALDVNSNEESQGLLADSDAADGYSDGTGIALQSANDQANNPIEAGQLNPPVALTAADGVGIESLPPVLPPTGGVGGTPSPPPPPQMSAVAERQDAGGIAIDMTPAEEKAREHEMDERELHPSPDGDTLSAPLVSAVSSDGTMPLARKPSRRLSGLGTNGRLSGRATPTVVQTADTTAAKNDSNWLTDALFVPEPVGASKATKGTKAKKKNKKKAGGGKKGPKDPNEKTESELEMENKRRKALGLPEVTESDYLQSKKDEEQDDVKQFVKQIKEMTGLWDEDPMDSTWINLERTNRKKGNKKEPMGSCCIGIQIWPVDKTLLQPVGTGRSDPNNTPYCPPPTGRLKFSWNPFVMGMELFGPKVCCYIICACLCVLLLLMLIYCQPIINIFITLAFSGN